MRKLFGAIAIVCVCAGLIYAQANKTASTPSTSATLKQIEKDWIDALKAGDTDKVAGFMADNWTGIGPDGVRMSKAQYLASLKAGDFKYASIDIGPMDVWTNGSVGVVQGSDNEKSTTKGKDSSGKYSWMDVFMKGKD